MPTGVPVTPFSSTVTDAGVPLHPLWMATAAWQSDMVFSFIVTVMPPTPSATWTAPSPSVVRLLIVLPVTVMEPPPVPGPCRFTPRAYPSMVFPSMTMFSFEAVIAYRSESRLVFFRVQSVTAKVPGSALSFAEPLTFARLIVTTLSVTVQPFRVTSEKWPTATLPLSAPSKIRPSRVSDAPSELEFSLMPPMRTSAPSAADMLISVPLKSATKS